MKETPLLLFSLEYFSYTRCMSSLLKAFLLPGKWKELHMQQRQERRSDRSRAGLDSGSAGHGCSVLLGSLLVLC